MTMPTAPSQGDSIVNPSLVCTPEAYRGLAPVNAGILAGPHYSLSVNRRHSLWCRAAIHAGPVRRVLLSVHAKTAPDLIMSMVDGLRPKLGDADLDILLPAGFWEPAQPFADCIPRHATELAPRASHMAGRR